MRIVPTTDLHATKKEFNTCINTVLKMFAGIDEESHCAILKYQNKKKYRNKEILVKELVVQGVAKNVIKSLQYPHIEIQIRRTVMIMVKHDEWVPFSWHCSNCGTIVTGYKNAQGDIKVE